MTYKVWFFNPVIRAWVVNTFYSEAAVAAHTAHYERKYGGFPGYKPAVIEPMDEAAV